MRNPRRIATISTVALTVAMIAASALREFVGPTHGGGTDLTALPGAALGALFLGVLVWLGAFVGARLSVPHQRSDRLIQVLSLFFVVLGVVLVLPIQTHIVRIDLPVGSASTQNAGSIVPLLLLIVGGLLLPMLVALGITRILAVTLETRKTM